MADYEARIAPLIDKEFTITAEFGQYPSGGIHRALDITTGKNDYLYSICNGTVFAKGYEATGNGNYIILKDNSGMGFLYGHMDSPSILNVGDSVIIGQFVGIEGTTGNSSGIHLHLSMLDLSNRTSWEYNLPIQEYANPAEYMRIPNIAGITAIYKGTPTPPKLTKHYKTPLFYVKRINFI